MQSSKTTGEFFPDIANLDGTIAYFSMEIAISPQMPTYSGGLGVLAGDTLRSAADMGLPMAAVTLLHRKGYFRQHLSPEGVQSEQEQTWSPEQFLTEEEPRIIVQLEGRPVQVRAWRYDLEGINGHVVPIFLLDTNLEGNDPYDRSLTDHLYGGDTNYRLAQETVLGIGGARILEALEWNPSVYHLNEGHAALLAVALLERQVGNEQLPSATERDVEAVRQFCVFTTHTPVPAGHDRFSLEQAHRILGNERTEALERLGCCHEGLLNLTYVALYFSRFVNGVAMQHGKVSREMFPGYVIDAITNGVHATTWTSALFQQLLDRRLPRWRQDNYQLRYAIDIPEDEIVDAHAKNKQVLLDKVAQLTGERLNPAVFTIGFARRAATYKRADLLFTEPEHLVRIASQYGGLQVLYAGKAHPQDEPGKALIRRIMELVGQYQSDLLHVVYLENYDWELGALLTSGVDIWLNTPRRPYEASGTSGMKAALNAVPSLSILDGWWIEGCIEGITGWPIENGASDAEEAASLYRKLQQHILPIYRHDRQRWAGIMRSTLALNGSFFNTNRMLEQYICNAYRPAKGIAYSVEALETALAK
jgi:glycogen phosphorylase